MRNQAIGTERTWTEDVHGCGELTFTERIRQEYTNCVFSAGSVNGHPVDTIYLKLERDGVVDTFLLLRPDEAAAIAWCMSGCLWTHELAQLPEPEPQPHAVSGIWDERHRRWRNVVMSDGAVIP